MGACAAGNRYVCIRIVSLPEGVIRRRAFRMEFSSLIINLVFLAPFESHYCQLFCLFRRHCTQNSISCILVQVFDTVGYVITPQIYLIRTLRLLVVHTNTGAPTNTAIYALHYLI